MAQMVRTYDKFAERRTGAHRQQRCRDPGKALIVRAFRTGCAITCGCCTQSDPRKRSGMRQPVFFLSHGGGPWPWLDGPFREGFAWLEASLKALPAQLPERPRAVLAVGPLGGTGLHRLQRSAAGHGLRLLQLSPNTPTTSAILRRANRRWQRGCANWQVQRASRCGTIRGAGSITALSR